MNGSVAKGQLSPSWRDRARHCLDASFFPTLSDVMILAHLVTLPERPDYEAGWATVYARYDLGSVSPGNVTAWQTSYDRVWAELCLSPIGAD